MLGKQVVQQAGQKGNRGNDTGTKGGEEAEVVSAPCGDRPVAEQVADGAEAEAADGRQELFIDADDEGEGL